MADTSQEYVLTEQEKQFMALYNRLWIPVYDRLRALVDEHGLMRELLKQSSYS